MLLENKMQLPVAVVNPALELIKFFPVCQAFASLLHFFTFLELSVAPIAANHSPLIFYWFLCRGLPRMPSGLLLCFLRNLLVQRLPLESPPVRSSDSAPLEFDNFYLENDVGATTERMCALNVCTEDCNVDEQVAHPLRLWSCFCKALEPWGVSIEASVAVGILSAFYWSECSLVSSHSWTPELTWRCV